MRRLRAWWITRLDILAARAGIWAMNRLYGGGCAPPYEPACVGCDAGRMVERLEGLLGDLSPRSGRATPPSPPV